MVEEYLKDEQSEEYILTKRLAIAIGKEMGKGREGEELIDNVVSRYENDEELMAEYDNDVDRFREDVEAVLDILPESFREEMQDAYEQEQQANRKEIKKKTGHGYKEQIEHLREKVEQTRKEDAEEKLGEYKEQAKEIRDELQQANEDEESA